MREDWDDENPQQEGMEEEYGEVPVEGEVSAPDGRFGKLLGEDSRKFKLSGMFKDWFLDYSSYVILQRAVPHIVDGATLQLGIGGMPNVVGARLAQSDVKDLGMHTELCGDAYYELYKAGKLTNRKKAIQRGKGVTGIVFGSQALYDWADQNPGLVVEPLEYVNAPETIAQLDNMISINNCIAVDLYGQVCAESAGLRHISGTGGQLDYLTGAAMARGGKAFICMTSSFVDTSGTRRSRILPHFNGDIVTDPRSQAYYIVTEYGAVNLAGRSTWERAELLVSIAHPDFREELIAAAEKQKIWRKSNRR